MKKISNISVSSKSIKTRWYFKIFVGILLILMLIMSVVLIKVYIDINKKEAQKDDSAKNVIDSIDKNLDEYKIFENENGMLGVTGKDNRTLIEPNWNEICILSENSFVVSKMLGNKKKMGIIDNESNIVIPFIFEEFKSFNNEFIGGFIGKGDEFILFDKNGNSLSDKLWTGYKYSDKIMYLKDGKNEYRGKMEDGEFKYVCVNLNSAINNISYSISITDPHKINEIGIDNINKISYITNRYLDYLISNDPKKDFLDITTEQYYSSLLSDNLFKDCTIKKISDCNIMAFKEKGQVSFNFKIVINYDYGKKNVDLKNISSEITFNIVKDENNRLVIKSINKNEL